MGDIVSLVEKAMEATEQEEAEKLALKMQKGQFDLNDLAQQMKQLQKMGGIGGILGMLPGIGKIKSQIEDANLDNTVLKLAPLGDDTTDPVQTYGGAYSQMTYNAPNKEIDVKASAFDIRSKSELRQSAARMPSSSASGTASPAA